MKKSIKILSLVFTALMVLSSLCFTAVAEDAAIGYKLVANNGGDGYITAEIYVQNGIALVGQLGIEFDTTKVELVNYDKTAITTKNLTDIVKSVIGTLEEVDPDNADEIIGDSSVIITTETNSDDVLVGDGALYFAWFANYTATIDATVNAVKIAEVKFAVKDGATGLEEAITLCTAAPAADTGIVGYKSGMYISEYVNGKAVSHYADRAPLLSYTVAYKDGGEFIVTDDVLVDYNGEGGEVGIPGGVTKIETSVFDEKTTTILLPTGVTEVAEGAFVAGTKVYVSPKVGVSLIANLKAQNYSVILYGDANSDGSVDAKDMTLFLKNAAGNADAAANITTDTKVLDTKYDSKYNLKDLSALVKYLAGAIDIGYQG